MINFRRHLTDPRVVIACEDINLEISQILCSFPCDLAMRELFVSSFKLICKVCSRCAALLLRNRFLSKTDLSARFAESLTKSSVFRSHFCEIQLFATCLSFPFCLQASLHRGQSWNWKIRTGAGAGFLSLLVALTFCLTLPPPRFHTTAAFVLSKSWNKFSQIWAANPLYNICPIF